MDFRGNNLGNLKEIAVLDQFPRLEKITFEFEEDSNPFCQDKESYISQIAALSIASRLKVKPLIQLVDGRVPGFTSKKPDLQEKEKENISNNENLPEESLYKVLIRKYEDKIAFLQAEVSEAKELNRVLSSNYEADLRDLRQKFEFRFSEMSSKCQAHDEIKVLLQSKEKEMADLRAKKDSKDERIQSLLLQLNELASSSNNSLTLLSQKDELIHKLNAKNESTNAELEATRIALRNAERNLNELQNKSIESFNKQIQASEKFKERTEALSKENHEQISEINKLKERISDLLSVCKEWELKFELNVAEQRNFQERFIFEKTREMENQMSAFERNQNQILQTRENEFFEKLKSFEEECKSLLRESNARQTQLKAGTEALLANYERVKGAYETLRGRHEEGERLIDEIKSMLLESKRSLHEVASEKEALARQVEIMRLTQAKEKEFFKSEIETLMMGKRDAERKAENARNEKELEESEVQLLRERVLALDKLELDIDEMRESLNTKNQMLEDKNETIEALKKENESLKSSSQNKSEDWSRINRKLEKKSLMIQQLETRISELSEENEGLVFQLSEKKELLAVLESEVEQLQRSQTQEISKLKQEKTKFLSEIEELQTQIFALNSQKSKLESSLKNLETEYTSIQSEFQAQISSSKLQIAKRDELVKSLNARIEENEEDMKVLISEIEKYRKFAKQIFN